ncbi:MAG: uncharacterized protein KVP18_000925 [Porospora cf. gigantea A]|uniref:uncharacterized protein n=1 Tax=Porospora cf. gigantea A TaxID=2853593 RepID=UPI00355A4202|nr:MAG: hypothetical protein KVP18_000925 [Porospora cf. gigantea A]
MVRWDFSQSTAKIEVAIYLKGLLTENVDVKIEETSLTVNVVNDTPFILAVARLYDGVMPANSSWRVSPYKVEISLAKRTPGVLWPSLEHSLQPANSVSQSDATAGTVRDWDKLLKEEVVEDDAFNTGDKSMAFFRKLYNDADPDTQRAMMKSYVESSGTSLSTNWAEVQQKNYAENAEPPEGQLAKSWEM